MNSSPADALQRLLEGEVDRGCRITNMSRGITHLNNGIKYFAVEVTSETGVQYGIAAYDREAEELHRLAMGKKAPATEMPLIA